MDWQSLREPWPGIVCVSQGTDTERQREMGRRARWHSGANSNRDLGQASSWLWHWVNQGQNNKDRLCGQAFCWLLAMLCKNTRSLHVFIRQAAEANMHIAKAETTSQILVFIDKMKSDFWTKKAELLLWYGVQINTTLIYIRPITLCFNSPLHFFLIHVSFPI